MQTLRWFGIALASSLSLGGLISSLPERSAQAVQMSDGTVYFNTPPTLDNAYNTVRRTTASNSIYYFTLTLPENSGEPLQRIAIAQRDGDTAARLVQYDTNDTQAFTGTHRRQGEPLTVGQTTYDRNAQTVSVILDPPVPPGTTVTIGLHPVRNPRMDGIYLFGVTAYPAGEKTYGQFLGYGRLTFDSPDHNGIFF